jgi:hypothetical protein
MWVLSQKLNFIKLTEIEEVMEILTKLQKQINSFIVSLKRRSVERG